MENSNLELLLEEVREINKKVSEIEKNSSCKSCKNTNPFTYAYLKNHVLTKKYLFNVILKSITKTIVITFLTLFFFDI
jgi:hypothetical protein